MITYVPLSESWYPTSGVATYWLCDLGKVAQPPHFLFFSDEMNMEIVSANGYFEDYMEQHIYYMLRNICLVH